MLLNQDQDLLADLSIAICSSLDGPDEKSGILASGTSSNTTRQRLNFNSRVVLDDVPEARMPDSPPPKPEWSNNELFLYF